MDVSIFSNCDGGRSTNVNSNDIVGGTMIPMAFGVDGRRPFVSESVVPRQAALEWLLLLCIHWIASPSEGTIRRKQTYIGMWTTGVKQMCVEMLFWPEV
uniref:Uncharacterized protein n=1 Tax=Oryza meridionalis TaxID=40149 RepID=A0A0E0CE99_9ORYZ